MPDTHYLFRHGPIDPHLMKAGRSIDCPLSPEGVGIAIQILQFLYSEKIHTVVTTGRRRTDLIGKILIEMGVRHVIEKRLQERHVPLTETWEEVLQKHPGAKRCGQDADALAYPNGETCNQVCERVVQAWRDLERQNISKLAIVSHGTSNQFLLATILKSQKRNPQEFGSMIQIDFRGERPQIVLERNFCISSPLQAVPNIKQKMNHNDAIRTLE